MSDYSANLRSTWDENGNVTGFEAQSPSPTVSWSMGEGMCVPNPVAPVMDCPPFEVTITFENGQWTLKGMKP